jgi:hypothetical protein
MSGDWHIGEREGEGIGPFSEDGLRALIREGKVSAKTLYWRSGAVERRALAETEEFRTLFAQPSQPEPPPAEPKPAAPISPEVKYQTGSERYWKAFTGAVRRAWHVIAGLGVAADLMLKRRFRRRRLEYLRARIGEGVSKQGAAFADTPEFRWLIGQVKEVDQQMAAVDAELARAKSLYSGKSKDVPPGRPAQ